MGKDFLPRNRKYCLAEILQKLPRQHCMKIAILTSKWVPNWAYYELHEGPEFQCPKSQGIFLHCLLRLKVYHFDIVTWSKVSHFPDLVDSIDRPILSKPIMLIRMQITTSDYWIWFIKAFRCKISRSRKSWIIKPMLKCYSFAKQALFQPIYCLGKFQVSIWLEVAFITTSR